MATYEELIQAGYNRGEALRALAGSGVAAPAALTSPADIPAAYNEANMQQLRDDVAMLHSRLTALIAFVNGGS